LCVRSCIIPSHTALVPSKSSDTCHPMCIEEVCCPDCASAARKRRFWMMRRGLTSFHRTRGSPPRSAFHKVGYAAVAPPRRRSVKHDTALRRTAEHWSHHEPRIEQSLFGFPPSRPYLIRTAFGEAAAEVHADNPWWAEDIVVDRYLAGRPPSSVLSLCCGFGAVEQHLLPRLPTVTTCAAIDIAPLADTEARRRAQALRQSDCGSAGRIGGRRLPCVFCG